MRGEAEGTPPRALVAPVTMRCVALNPGMRLPPPASREEAACALPDMPLEGQPGAADATDRTDAELPGRECGGVTGAERKPPEWSCCCCCCWSQARPALGVAGTRDAGARCALLIGERPAVPGVPPPVLLPVDATLQDEGGR